MAESTLGITYDDLRLALAHFLGLSLTEGDWTDDEETILDMIIKRGLRQFYFPPPVNNEEPYEWSFLKPVVTITTIAPYSTGTIAVVLAGTTVTITTGTWPSWAATHGSLVVDNTEYVISSRTSDSEIELESAWTEDTETAAEFTLRHSGDYDLPDDFGGIEGILVNESSTNRAEIKIVGEGKIRSLRQNNYVETSPYYAAIKPKEHETTTVGQRFEISFYPVPDAVYDLSYKKRILPQMLVDTTLIYPYGGASHAETLLASCLAVADEQENDSSAKKGQFQERLAASIAIDKQFNSVNYFGYNSDDSDLVHQESNGKRTGFVNNLVQYEP